MSHSGAIEAKRIQSTTLSSKMNVTTSCARRTSRHMHRSSTIPVIIIHVELYDSGEFNVDFEPLT